MAVWCVGVCVCTRGKKYFHSAGSLHRGIYFLQVHGLNSIIFSPRCSEFYGDVHEGNRRVEKGDVRIQEDAQLRRRPSWDLWTSRGDTPSLPSLSLSTITVCSVAAYAVTPFLHGAQGVHTKPTSSSLARSGLRRCRQRPAKTRQTALVSPTRGSPRPHRGSGGTSWLTWPAASIVSHTEFNYIFRDAAAHIRLSCLGIYRAGLRNATARG